MRRSCRACASSRQLAEISLKCIPGIFYRLVSHYFILLMLYAAAVVLPFAVLRQVVEETTQHAARRRIRWEFDLRLKQALDGSYR